ncbi:MAG: hypothetical protein K2P55_05075 [Bacteroides acidifaciens]|nr:hypothetical protein [Bacteroides acidifaciens]
MTNRQIVAQRKKDLARAQRGLANSTDPQMKAYYREIIEWCKFEITDLESAIAMGADDLDGGLAGWIAPVRQDANVQVVRIPGLC